MECVMFQEVELLRKSIYPSLLCSAAQEGSLEALEKLKEAVSANMYEKVGLSAQNLKGLF